MDAEMFTGETVRIFNRLKAVQFRDRTNINEENSAELTLLVLSMRYSKKPKYDIWKISLEIVEILSVSRKFAISIRKAIERIGKEEEVSEESTKIISDENNSDDETKERESSKPEEEVHEMEENGVITIYMNRKGIFNITGTGKEFRIEIDENNDKKRLSGNEVIELCGSTTKDMNSVFEEIDELIQKLNEEQEKITLLKELEDDIENTQDEKRKKDKKLPDANGGRINVWNDASDADTLARSFVTKFKEEFVSEEAKEEKKREWFYQWEKIRQLPEENIDTYTKKFQKMVRNAERVITEKEKVVTYQEGLLPIYYANATVGDSANLTEAIRNARNSERGVLRQMFSNQDYRQTNKVYQELQKKDVKPEEIDNLKKIMKEMKIWLMKKFEGSNGYEKRNRRYDNFDKKEIICYKCKEKGHYASECGNRKDIKCNICGKIGHYARACREKNQSGYSTKNNERHLNYIGIYSSEGSSILDDEFSSDEDEEKRFYPISTRSQKYENAGTNTRRNKMENF